MKIEPLVNAAVLIYVLAPCVALGATSTADDRIAVSADGATLSGTNGGGGGSLGWLHNFDADSIGTVGAEYQKLASAHWAFGSLSGSLTRGPVNQRYSFYAEAHEGTGDDGPKAFDYHIEAVGVISTYYRKLSVQVEDRRVDVETTHGNLPKIGLSYLWGPHFQTAVAYQYSVSGNLGTRLTSVRIDNFGAKVNFLGGVAFGQASATVLNLGIELPGRQLKEGYVGVSKPFVRQRSELTLVCDYLDLSGSKKATVTLNYIFHVGAASTAR
ncbi:MAG: hypothetical protein M3N91_01275 [Pseudomonadota bacterium]|nr:hypothetical protein [Pseudomonadota bacterium]